MGGLELSPERPSECGKDTGEGEQRLSERSQSWGTEPHRAEMAYLQVCRQRKLPKRTRGRKKREMGEGQKYPNSCSLFGPVSIPPTRLHPGPISSECLGVNSGISIFLKLPK